MILQRLESMEAKVIAVAADVALLRQQEAMELDRLKDHESRMRHLEWFQYALMGGLAFLAAEIPVVVWMIDAMRHKVP